MRHPARPQLTLHMAPPISQGPMVLKYVATGMTKAAIRMSVTASDDTQKLDSFMRGCRG